MPVKWPSLRRRTWLTIADEPPPKYPLPNLSVRRASWWRAVTFVLALRDHAICIGIDAVEDFGMIAVRYFMAFKLV